MSKEHYISKAVLEVLSQDGRLQVSGFPWLPPGITKWVSPAALQSHILCERHNSALSPLDSLASRFFRSLWRVNEEFAGSMASTQNRLFLFNGYDIERFMFKWLCGLLVSESASTPQGKLLARPVPESLLRYLYCQESLASDWGMYCDAEIGKAWESVGGVGFAPLADELRVYGCLWYLTGLKFIFVIHSPPKDKRGSLLEHTNYRPKEIAFTNGKCEKVILMAWGRRSSDSKISIAYSPVIHL
jgi:hypothetical protein